MALFDGGDGLRASVDGRQEILHVMADGRRDVAFEILFGAVFRILFKFVSDVAMDGRAAVCRNEVVAVDTGFEGAFVAVEGGAPGVFGIGRISPGAVLPDDAQIVEVEGSCLGIGDVRFARFVFEDAAEMRVGQARSSIQRVISNMWTAMSPTIPLPYSMKARQVRG